MDGTISLESVETAKELVVAGVDGSPSEFERLGEESGVRRPDLRQQRHCRRDLQRPTILPRGSRGNSELQLAGCPVKTLSSRI